MTEETNHQEGEDIQPIIDVFKTLGEYFNPKPMEPGLNSMLFGDDPDCAFDDLTDEEIEALEHDEDYNEEYENDVD
jgi:hypothetical protein